MVGFLVAAAEAVRSAQCQVLSANEYLAGSVGRFNPVARVTAPIALNAIRRLLGCDPQDDYENPDPPFTGGQCAGVSYQVFLSGRSGSGSTIGSANRTGQGPVGGVCFGPVNFGLTRVGVVFADGCQDAGGGISTTSPANQSSWAITSVVRLDGQPDDCGSPEPTYPPPINFNFNTDVTYEGDDGTEITVNVPFVFAPIKVDFNGDLRIPVDFSLGGFEFSGNVNLPDFNLTINPPRLPPGSGDDLSGQGGDDEGETTPPTAPDEKIIGVVVTATQIDSRRVSSYSSPGIPPIFVPRLGSIKFVYSIGSATFFSSDIDIKDRRTFIPCPFSQGADAVIASPNIGVSLVSTPIRGFPIATTADLQTPT